MHYRHATRDGQNRTTESNASATDTTTDGTVRIAGITAIVVGSSGSVETTDGGVEAGTQETDGDEEPPPGHLVLIPMSEYRPGLTVRVVERLPAPIAVRLLRLPNGETVPVLEQPDEYTGYVARAASGDELVRSTMIVFTRESLETDARYAFENDSQVFSTRLNLFRATARPLEAGDDPADVLELEGEGTGNETESDDQ